MELPTDDADSDSDEQGGVVNTDQRVHEAIAAISDEVTISSWPTDEAEGEMISRFLISGCGCKKKAGMQ